MNLKNRQWNRQSIIGAVMIAASIVLIIVGVLVSSGFKMPRLFWLFSAPAAVLIVAGGVKLLHEFAPEMAQQMYRNNPNSAGPAWSLRKLPAKVEAEVIGVTRNIRNAGDKMAYYVLCKWKDPKTGQEYTYTSRALQEYPGKDVIGKKVTVHLDKKDPGNYTVDLEPILPDELKLK